MKAKFEHMTFAVRDIEAAKRFFADLLGATFEDQPEEAKLEFIPRADKYVGFKSAMSSIGLELFQTDPLPEKEGVWNTTWRVDDIEAAKKECIAKGLRHLYDVRCGAWKEAVFAAETVHGVRFVLNEFPGNNIFKAMVAKPK